MINIEIKTSEKLNSNKSAFVSFQYSPLIVETIKTLPFRHYNPDNKTWEIPLDYIKELQNKLPTYQFKVTGEIDKNKRMNIPETYKFKTKPYEYQLDAVKYGLEHDFWFLGDQMGCVSGDSEVFIKEQGKPATRQIKIKRLQKAFDSDNTIQIKCMVNERFAYMPIKAVIDKGIQKTIRITLENTSIECTPDHLIYTKFGWLEAGNLIVGDEVFTNGKQVCPLCGTSENLVTYKYSKFIGYCKPCMYKLRNSPIHGDASIVKQIDSDGYVRLRGVDARFMPNWKQLVGQGGIYEHHQVWHENTGHIVDTSKEVVHHINGIKTDNRFENLQLLTISEHDKLHSDVKKNHLYQFNKNLDYIERCGTKIYLVPNLQKVVKIETIGEQQVWDIAIDDEEIHNFICNNIIVHNCGKTKESIDIACIRKQLYGYNHCLVVCGVNTLKWNWVKEVNIHSYESGYILGQRLKKNGKTYVGSTKDKISDLKNINEITDYFLITNVESFRDKEFAELVNKLCKNNVINMCIADESHKMKNPTSQQTKGFLKCNPECKITMTGTPLMNNPLDLYVILKWLGYEQHPFYAFKQYYCMMGGYGGYEIVGYKHMDELTDQLQSIMLRRLKGDVLDLPEKTYIDEYVEMTDKQNKVYAEVEMSIKSELTDIVQDVNPLSRLIRLRQATGYTGILSDTIKESAKLDRMVDIVDECVENGEKVLIFSNWTSITDIVSERILDMGWAPLVITGDTKDEDRQSYVDMFQTRENNPVLIGTIGAAGTGLTMTAATTIIFMDEPWNKALYDQAVDRTHRVGQTNKVTIYNLICKDTIDEKIHNLVYEKGAMSDAIVDGKIMGDKTQIVRYLLS